MDHNHVKMTSAEIAFLWSSYISDSLTRCMFEYFLVIVEDPDIRKLVEEAHQGCLEHLGIIAERMTRDGMPEPLGFTEADVNRDAPRLYSDTTLLYFLKNRTMIIQNINAMGASMVAREDLRAFFSKRVAQFDQMNNQQTQTMLEKGVYVRPPVVELPERVDFVEKKGFLNAMLNKRPLLAQEAAILFMNQQANALGASVLTGYIQTAQDQDVREYLQRGYELSCKFASLFANELNEEKVTFATNAYLEVTDSKVPPFSDKLMLAHVDALNATGITNYGMGVSSSFRRDLGAMYLKCLSQTLEYAHDGAQLVIEKGWLEQPPQV